MFFTRENETLHLSNFEYNAALIINELKEIIITNGGRVESNKSGYIVNRTLNYAIIDTTKKIEAVEAVVLKTTDEARLKKQKQYLNSLRDKLAKYQAINNEPVAVTALTYISFVYEGNYYYYQISNNFLFDFYFKKAPIINGDKYSLSYAMNNDPKEWLLDCYLKCDCTDTERREAANLIFNMLVNAPISQYVRNTKRVRVANLYDDGYHYENVAEPERFEKIDF